MPLPINSVPKPASYTSSKLTDGPSPGATPHTLINFKRLFLMNAPLSSSRVDGTCSHGRCSDTANLNAFQSTKHVQLFQRKWRLFSSGYSRVNKGYLFHGSVASVKAPNRTLGIMLWTSFKRNTCFREFLPVLGACEDKTGLVSILIVFFFSRLTYVQSHHFYKVSARAFL